MFRTNKGLINLLLSTVSFAVSSAGSILLYIIFAMFIYEKSESALLTSLFVSLQWLPVLLVIIFRSDWDHGMNPRKRWYLIDLACALLTLPILFFVEDFNYALIIPVLFARGILDQINRINRTVAAKVLFPPDKSTYYASFLQTGYHVGIGLAAISAIYLKDRINLETLVIINIATFMLSALLISCTRCIENIDFAKVGERKSLKSRMLAYKEALSADARLFYCAILPPATATFFQGTYSVLQPIFPVKALGLGAAEVSLSYVLATIAIVLGSFCFSTFAKQYRLFDKPFINIIGITSCLSVLACLSYILSMSAYSPLMSAVFFTLMIFLFEFIWMNGYAGIVAYAPNGKLGAVFGITFCIGCTLASLISACTGLIVDMTDNNFLLTILLFMTTYLIIIGSAWIIFNKLEYPNKMEMRYGQLD